MGNIVNSQVQKIAQVSQHFAKLKVDVEDSGTSLIKKQKVMMIEKKNLLLEERKKLEEEIEIIKSKSDKIKEDLKTFHAVDEEKDEKHIRLVLNTYLKY